MIASDLLTTFAERVLISKVNIAINTQESIL